MASRWGAVGAELRNVLVEVQGLWSVRRALLSPQASRRLCPDEALLLSEVFDAELLPLCEARCRRGSRAAGALAQGEVRRGGASVRRARALLKLGVTAVAAIAAHGRLKAPVAADVEGGPA